MFEEELIEAVQQHNCLYDKSAQVYRNKLIKEKTWISVAAAAGATVEQCQGRWRSLRDRYVKEASVKPKSGSGVESESSRWRFYDTMSFLQRHVAPRRTLSNVQWSSTEDSINSSFLVEEESASSPSQFIDYESGGEAIATSASTSQGKRRTCQKVREEANDRFQLLCSAASELIAERKQVPAKSRNEEFFKVLDGYLQKHSEEDQDKLKMRILNMVYTD